MMGKMRPCVILNLRGTEMTIYRRTRTSLALGVRQPDGPTAVRQGRYFAPVLNNTIRAVLAMITRSRSKLIFLT